MLAKKDSLAKARKSAKKQADAAINIQRFARGTASRQKQKQKIDSIRKEKLKCESATKIQSLARGAAVRTKMHSALVTACVLLIQKAVRVWRSRTEYAWRKKMVAVLANRRQDVLTINERIWAMLDDEDRLAAQNVLPVTKHIQKAAAINIQSCYRRFEIKGEPSGRNWSWRQEDRGRRDSTLIATFNHG